jgi:hypothetical protein
MRRSAQAIDHGQDGGEYAVRNCDLGHLEDGVDDPVDRVSAKYAPYVASWHKADVQQPPG